jgi:copper chaperone NosL
MMRVLKTTLAAPITLAALAGCGGTEAVSPPVIHYGEQECAECRMIVSEERFAAGAVARVDGRLESFAFDDLGCMLTWADGAGREVLGLFVHDLDSAEWIEAARAFYLRSRHVHTPMAFGVAAYAERERALAAQTAMSGEVIDFAGLEERHAAGELNNFPFDEGSDQ